MDIGTRKGFRVSPGPHLVYARAYARNSVSVTRDYGLSQTVEVNVSDGEDKRLSCGRVKGPPVRAVLVLTCALVTLLLAFGPLGDIPVRTRYTATIIAALATMGCSWIGHSSAPGTNIYLK
jgi:hypothetical protein